MANIHCALFIRVRRTSFVGRKWGICAGDEMRSLLGLGCFAERSLLTHSGRTSGRCGVVVWLMLGGLAFP